MRAQMALDLDVTDHWMADIKVRVALVSHDLVPAVGGARCLHHRLELALVLVLGCQQDGMEGEIPK